MFRSYERAPYNVRSTFGNRLLGGAALAFKGIQNKNALLYVIGIAPAAIILVFAILQASYPLEELLRDPLAVAAIKKDGRVHYGIVSQIGVLVWAFTAGALFITALVAFLRGARNKAMFFAMGALITGLLLVDDLFMIHEYVWVHRVGSSEEVLYGFYAVLTCSYLFLFRREISQSGTGVLAVSLVFFAISILVDKVAPLKGVSPFYWITEDGGKLAGITCWATFHTRAGNF